MPFTHRTYLAIGLVYVASSIGPAGAAAPYYFSVIDGTPQP